MRHLVLAVTAVLALGGLSGCGDAPGTAKHAGGNSDKPGTSKSGGSTSAKAGGLSGSGSTFIKPIMDKWIAEYTKGHPGEINYQSQGSGAGIKQMTDQAVDFGCTDAFMKKDQLAAAEKAGGKVIHVPLAMGAIAVAYNVPGLDKPLNFSGEVLAEIYLGNVTKWNDAKIKELNPGVNLPDKAIAVVHRSDSSGSSAIFTEFLSKHSEDWKTKVGAGTSPTWPAGIGENQTAGVAGAITKSEGSIGYIELFYALQNKIPFGALKNSEGKFVAPSLDSVSAAGAALVEAKKVPDDLRYSLVDAPGEKSYPLSGTTWAVLYVNQGADKAKELKSFLGWVLQKGQDYAKSMDYAPLPESLVGMAQKKVELIEAK
jgi:phosphate transport system substrate-binding protein